MRKSILLPIIILGTLTIEAFIPQLDGRIVGGKDANITSFPYQVSLLRGLSHVCGGSIFHTNYILTAAHCVHGYLTTLFSIRVGSSIANQGDGTFKVCKIHIHDKFDQNTMDNDIAILTLCSPLKFSATVLPIALPGSSEAIPTGAKATVTGWGVLKETDKAVSKILQQVDIPILSQKSCLSAYGGEYITSNMFCAGYVAKGAKDACQGDSGGPLMANGKLFGIVSWGVGCAHPKYPGVYTNVPVFRGWIRDYTKY